MSSTLRAHAIHQDVRFTRAITTAVHAELEALASWLGLVSVDREGKRDQDRRTSECPVQRLTQGDLQHRRGGEPATVGCVGATVPGRVHAAARLRARNPGNGVLVGARDLNPEGPPLRPDSVVPAVPGVAWRACAAARGQAAAGAAAGVVKPGVAQPVSRTRTPSAS